MKTVPTRSPSRRSSPPPPPRMSHRSPSFRRGRSPERRRRVESHTGSRMSPSRSRERREFRTSPRSQPPDFAVPRRSRSPIRESRRRSFSPKKKSPKLERRETESVRSSRLSISRKQSRSKSPTAVIDPHLHETASHVGQYSGPSEGPPPASVYQGRESYAPAEPVVEVERSTRGISTFSERADECSYDKSELKKMTIVLRNNPIFRGPEGNRFNTEELKNIKIDVPNTRRLAADFNPDEIVLVRRPNVLLDGQYNADHSHCVFREQYINERRSPSPKSRRNLSPWEQEEAMTLNLRRNKSEGSRPIFAREEITKANRIKRYELGSSYDHSIPTEEHQRVVAVPENPPHTQTSGGHRFESPVRYSTSRAPPSYFEGDRERGSSTDYGRSKDFERSHGPGYDSRDKHRDDHFERRDDLRDDLEMRGRDDHRYSSRGDNMRSYDKGRDYRESDRNSDLRMRIHEKRSDRHDDHDRHPADRHEMERQRERDRERAMMRHSPPGERRRGPMEGGYSRGYMGDRKMRGDMRRGPGPRSGPGGRPSERFHEDPEFGPRPERFHGSKPWDVNPEYVPKGRAYFEHDNRDEMRMPSRGRGPMGPRGHMRGRGMMFGRSFRGSGPQRGYMGGRGSGRRGVYIPRYKQSSPHWEHDLFDNASPAHGNNGFSK